jgi:DNA sulfur modification protein DndE
MTKIWSPTNLAWVINRILVKGPDDVPNVHAIQDQIMVKSLSVFQGQPVPSSQAAADASKEVPIGLQPKLIPTTGIKIYDEIAAAMIGNPLNPPDPVLVTKLASIGIGPGKTPSTQSNDTIKAALQTGITEGQKLIDAKVANAGTVVNRWLLTPQTGVYGADYLFRAAVTQLGLGANIAQEALYPATFTDIERRPLNGTNNYVIHFNPGQIPPVKAFWSISMYNNISLFVDNPINRYAIGQFTQGLKNNADGSLDIYIQNAGPGKDKESNWLPAPQGSGFNLILRMYLPAEQVLNGTWTPPAVQQVG